MSTHPTSRQKQVLDFIHHTVEERGYAPSYREIARHLNITGTRAVEKHIAALGRKGHLRKGAGARALEVTGRAFGRSVPIVGRVAAGAPILAEENVEGNLTLDSSLIRVKDSFLLRVKGDSMTGAGILNGDLVLVRPQKDADSGEIVVAIRDGEATVKRLIKKNGAVTLKPENPHFKPIQVTEQENFEMVGKVVGVFRLP